MSPMIDVSSRHWCRPWAAVRLSPGWSRSIWKRSAYGVVRQRKPRPLCAASVAMCHRTRATVGLPGWDPCRSHAYATLQWHVSSRQSWFLLASPDPDRTPTTRWRKCSLASTAEAVDCGQNSSVDPVATASRRMWPAMADATLSAILVSSPVVLAGAPCAHHAAHVAACCDAWTNCWCAAESMGVGPGRVDPSRCPGHFALWPPHLHRSNFSRAPFVLHGFS